MDRHRLANDEAALPVFERAGLAVGLLVFEFVHEDCRGPTNSNCAVLNNGLRQHRPSVLTPNVSSRLARTVAGLRPPASEN